MSSLESIITVIRPSLSNSYLEYDEYEDYNTAIDEMSQWCYQNQIPCDREVYGILNIDQGEVKSLPLDLFVDAVSETVGELTENLEY